MRVVVIVIALLLFTARSARAEDELQLWLEAGVAKELNKRFEVSFDQHLRFDQDISRAQSIMPEAGISMRVRKFLRLSLGYRLMYERNKLRQFEVRHRGFGDVRPRLKLGAIELNYRLRYQVEARPANDPRHTVRNRIAVELSRTAPWVPAISAESFHRLDDGPVRLSKIRLTAGISYKFFNQEIELAYKVEVAQEDPTDPTPHVIGVGYHYTFKRKKRKKHDTEPPPEPPVQAPVDAPVGAPAELPADSEP
jgi:hypothetical protein